MAEKSGRKSLVISKYTVFTQKCRLLKNDPATNVVGCDAGRFIGTPVNTHHTLGNNKTLRLNCSARFDDPSSNQLEWVGRAVSENLTENGAVKPQWRHKYEIKGDFDLVFKDPELSDAGKYECRTSDGSTENLRHNAQVIISGEARTYIYRTAHLGVGF